MNPQLYDHLNKAWKATCRVLFGNEIGELKDYEAWLEEYADLPRMEQSTITGKEVFLPNKEYCKDAKWVAYGEVDLEKKFEPLDINEIKDVDSIISALQERFCYAGNVVLGNSSFVEASATAFNGHYAYRASGLHNSKYVAYSKAAKDSSFIFGATGGGSDFILKGIVVANSQRCFETWSAIDVSDAYYSASLSGCSNCLFCFNLKGKRRAIGNLELSNEKFKDLKEKLITEIVDELKAKKRAPPLFELIRQFPRSEVPVAAGKDEKFDITPINNAFKKTFRLLLKADPQSGIDSYGGFLKKHTPESKTYTKTSSKHPVYIPGFIYDRLTLPETRLISVYESSALSEKPIALSSDEVDGLSLHNLSALSKIAFLPLSTYEGKNDNIGESALIISSTDCYKGSLYAFCKLCAFTCWPRHSSYMFGSSFTLNSSFCINSYYSDYLTRAFEVDNCNSCSDIYFSHNCENVHDSMFCFGKKNLSYAIGNAPLLPETYRKAKDAIVQQLADELIRKKDLIWDIYNIGCAGKL